MSYALLAYALRARTPVESERRVGVIILADYIIKSI